MGASPLPAFQDYQDDLGLLPSVKGNEKQLNEGIRSAGKIKAMA